MYADDSIVIAIWVNCSIDHKGVEDSLVCALIYISGKSLLLSCQPRVIIMSRFVYKTTRDL